MKKPTKAEILGALVVARKAELTQEYLNAKAVADRLYEKFKDQLENFLRRDILSLAPIIAEGATLSWSHPRDIDINCVFKNLGMDGISEIHKFEKSDQGRLFRRGVPSDERIRHDLKVRIVRRPLNPKLILELSESPQIRKLLDELYK